MYYTYVAAANYRKKTKKQSPIIEETDSGKSDDGWVVCKDQSKYKISRMGNPMLCIGATFTVVPKYSNRFLHGHVIEIGKIASVVRQKGSSVPWFKFYDFEKYPMGPPERGTSEYMYVECATILSTDSKKTGIKWTRRHTVSKQNAKRTKTFFEIEYGPSRGFDDQLDNLRKNKRATKKATAIKDYCSENDCSSSDSISSTKTASDSEEEVVCELKDDSDDDLGDNDSDDNDVLVQEME